MKKLNSTPTCLVFFLILALSSLTTAQDFWPNNYDEGNIFTVTNGRQLLEFWEGRPGEFPDFKEFVSIFLIDNNKLVANGYHGDKAVFDANGNNTAFLSSFRPYKLVTRNNSLYCIKMYNHNWQEVEDGDVKLLRFNDKLRLEDSVDLEGVNSDYYLSEYAITRNGHIYLTVHLIDDDGYNCDYAVYLFDANGNQLNYFQMPGEIEHPESVETDGQGNLVILTYLDDIYIVSPKGKIIRSLNYSGDDYITGIRLTRENTLLISYLFSKNVDEVSTTGTLIKTVALDIDDSVSSRVEVKNVVRTAKGTYIAAYGDYRYARISEFDQDGSLIKHFYPSKNEEPAQAAPKRAAGLVSICQGPDDTLLGVSAIDLDLHQVSMDGEILMSFNLPQDKRRPKAVKMDSKNRVLLLYNDRIDVYSPKGKFRRSYKSPSGDYKYNNAANFALDKEDNIYILRGIYHDYSHHVVVLNSKGKPIGQMFKNDPDPYAGIEVDDMAIDKDDNILILWQDKNIKVYNKKGKEIDEINRGPFIDRIFCGPSGNIYMICSFSEGLIITDPNKNRLAYTSDYIYTCAFEGSNGRLYLGGWDRTVVANNLQRHYWRGEVADISGKVRANKGSLIKADLYNTYICIEGTDPLGNHFQGICEGSWDGNQYKFNDVPVGSKVRIWIDNYQTDLMKFKKPLVNFSVKKAKHRRNFAVSTIPTDYVLIRGRIIRENGSPLQGVLISCGDNKVVSNRDGSYALSVPVMKRHEITVEKQGVTFQKESQRIRVKKADVLEINFTAENN